jgi:4'-phosphopantetheinyl transferase
MRQPARPACRVWWARLGQVRPGHLRLLDRVERERRDRYRSDADRDRFTLSASLTRLVLGEMLGRPPDRLAIERRCSDCGGPHGRPRLADDKSAPAISLSHSGDRVVLAAVPDGAVGVDVEQVRPIDVPAMAAEVLAPAEAAQLWRLPPEARPAGFLHYWTRKEAVLKAEGEGRRVAPKLLLVSAPGQHPRLLRWAGRPGLPDRLRLHQLHPGDGYLATVAVLDAPGVVVEELAAASILGT